jgi:protein gp37
LGDLGELNLEGVNWIIVGGESGSQARPMKEEWVLNIKRQADANNIPFFFKQWGTWSKDGVKGNKKINGKLLQGKIVQNMPFVNRK